MSYGIRMASPAATSPLAFETFWSWLTGHTTCIVEASVGDALIKDHDLAHWDVFQTREGDCICHLLIGKALLAQIQIDPKQVLLVHASPDPEDPESVRWVYDCLTGPEDDAYTFCSFTMAHGMEQTRGHQMVKH